MMEQLLKQLIFVIIVIQLYYERVKFLGLL